MKKILILSVTAGNGHNSCAQAMKQYLEDNFGATVEVVDLLKSFSTRINYWLADTGYDIAVGKLRPIYNLFLRHYQKISPAKRYSNACQSTCISTVSGLLKKIMEFRPDAIYCTHYECAVAVTDLKLAYNIPARTVVTCLDYSFSPFWESAIGVDYFVIPNEDFIEIGIEKGFDVKQLLPYGIPVKIREQAKSRKDILDELGLEDKFTAVVTFGGGHWKGAYKIFKMVVDSLSDKNAQIIVINGRDKSSYKKIAKKNWNITVLNIGYTNNVPLYLAVADVFISKGGGLSTTEAINASAPMVLYEKTPAQEQNNIEYLCKKGVAYSFSDKVSLQKVLDRLYNNPTDCGNMRNNMISLTKNALEKTAAILNDAPQADYSSLDAIKIDYKKVKRNVISAMRRADKVSRNSKKR